VGTEATHPPSEGVGGRGSTFSLSESLKSTPALRQTGQRCPWKLHLPFLLPSGGADERARPCFGPKPRLRSLRRGPRVGTEATHPPSEGVGGRRRCPRCDRRGRGLSGSFVFLSSCQAGARAAAQGPASCQGPGCDPRRRRPREEGKGGR